MKLHVAGQTVNGGRLEFLGSGPGLGRLAGEGKSLVACRPSTSNRDGWTFGICASALTLPVEYFNPNRVLPRKKNATHWTHSGLLPISAEPSHKACCPKWWSRALTMMNKRNLYASLTPCFTASLCPLMRNIPSSGIIDWISVVIIQMWKTISCRNSMAFVVPPPIEVGSLILHGMQKHHTSEQEKKRR